MTNTPSPASELRDLAPITDKIARYGDGKPVYHLNEAVVPVSIVLEYIELYKRHLAAADRTALFAQFREIIGPDWEGDEYDSAIINTLKSKLRQKLAELEAMYKKGDV